ncbi:ATP-binding protein [Phytohabitans rumicis]|uniref:ATPase n=1 Tax=Phytohabitans rumicis TaxID=1076125 RepID=A0A6V8LD16_9ACTN|nr:ATP-binding protein [Phytohabitans rumicis]GFJ92671.1 ATPase [Phytohabitans rumicis]
MTDVLTGPVAANQRGLVAALARVRQALHRHAGTEPPSPNGATGPDDDHPAALDALCGTMSLSPFERDILLMCAGVELDASFAAACAAASGDPARPYPTFGLALAALAQPHWSALAPVSPLRRWRLVTPAAGGLTTAALSIEERVLHYLVGVDHLDERLSGLAEALPGADEPTPSQGRTAAEVARVWRAAEQPLPVVQLCGPDPVARRTVAVAACRELGVRVVSLAADRLPSDPHELDALVRLCARDAALSGAGLLLEADDVDTNPVVSRVVAGLDWPVLVSTREARRLPHRATVAVQVGRPTAAEQRALWRERLGAERTATVDALAAQFDLGQEGIRGACRQAGTADEGALWDACRTRSRPALDSVAQRVEPAAGWADLVLPPAANEVLRQVSAHVAHRLTVYEDWGLGRAGASRGLGTSALFAGPSGTGKTLAAEVLARELRLDLYRVDLSQVVSKYIGETEKNLRLVFDAAEEGGTVLLFDEADALFGKRSEVRDSHDRYANIEVSYLLQRMETYRGLAILTTNMREAIDTAFLRRIRFVVQFPFPDANLRAEIWRRVFPPTTPTVDLDIATLARLNVAGGNIRNIAVNAAFLAAAAGEPVSMAHLAKAARGEYAKLDRPLTATEIGGWS